MARLQDFQSVSPTDSDKILIVQSQGQGLATYGSTIGYKMDKINPTGTGSLSLNRKSGTTIGNQSVAVGYNNEASGVRSFSEGANNVSSGNYSHTEGYQATASSDMAHAEGNGTTASGTYSHAEGQSTIANHRSQHVFGEYNVADTSTAAASSRGNYVEIVGKGSGDANRSNARTLDWSGNEVLAGDLTIQGNIPLGMRPYSKAINGVTYGLYMVGQIGVLTIITGSFTNAVSANETLISLADFSSDFTGKKFAASFQFVSATDTTKRFNCGSGTADLISVAPLASGYAPRGCVPVVII